MPLHVALVMEQLTGHVTHFQNLRRWMNAQSCERRDASCEHSQRATRNSQLAASWLKIYRLEDDLFGRLPWVRGNWSLLAGLRARRELGRAWRRRGFDALYFHTQVTSLCSLDLMRRAPAVVSLDATPINMDSVGAGYDHRPAGGGPLERIKRHWNHRAFELSAALAPWSRWAGRSLVDDYGVDPGKVHVIPPGVDLVQWAFAGPSRRESSGALPRVLFVGGQFGRKGGAVLLEAFAALRGRCTLDLVTQDRTVEASEAVRVHRGLQPNDPVLRGLFARADLFVLPTLGDCLPLAVMEAMAAGLPVIATRVGAIDEQVVNGETGLLVSPGDAAALAEAMRLLIDDEAKRRRFGAAARQRAERLFDAQRNYGRLIELIRTVAVGHNLQL